MKVRCVRLLDSSGKPQEKSGWLTIGKVYHVLEVIQNSRGKWMFRLLGDEPNGPALFQFEEFEIVASKIPASWTIAWGKDGFFELTPEAWRQTGFWEKYYDRNPDAIQVFEEEKRKLIDEGP